MSGGFELQPQDGGPRVALALGETVIGRGPLLGITDRRISRRHAILEVVGRQLRIKPEMPESFSATTLSNPDMHTMKINTQRNEIPIVGLAKVSKHKVMTKGTLNKEDEAASCAESCSSVQGKSFHSESQRCHPKFNLEASSSETLKTKATDSLPQSSQKNKVKRSSCMYGANCYRKNPVHFQHFSHPGDNDYGGVHVTGQDETDDRPECPYGASCYRKNLQHKIEYRHSILQVRNISDEDGDVGQPNEYDLNDSFLDDEGEEYEPTDEDSDWEPGKEDQEQEDVEELLKEAKKVYEKKKVTLPLFGAPLLFLSGKI